MSRNGLTPEQKQIVDDAKAIQLDNADFGRAISAAVMNVFEHNLHKRIRTDEDLAKFAAYFGSAVVIATLCVQRGVPIPGLQKRVDA